MSNARSTPQLRQRCPDRQIVTVPTVWCFPQLVPKCPSITWNREERWAQDLVRGGVDNFPKMCGMGKAFRNPWDSPNPQALSCPGLGPWDCAWWGEGEIEYASCSRLMLIYVFSITLNWGPVCPSHCLPVLLSVHPTHS